MKKKKPEPKDILKDFYFCPQDNESIAQARREIVPIDNNLWIKRVLEFYDKHKDHGFEL